MELPEKPLSPSKLRENIYRKLDEVLKTESSEEAGISQEEHDRPMKPFLDSGSP